MIDEKVVKVNNIVFLSDEELMDVEGGGGGIIIGLIAVPFVLGTIAGAADEYARKKGHK